MNSVPQNSGSAASSSLLARVIAGVVLINLFVLGLGGLSLRQSYQQFQEKAEVTTRNLAHTLENALSGTIRTDDIALLNIIDEYQMQRASGNFDGAALNAHIERLRSRLKEIDALRITDAKGTLIYGTGVDSTAHTSLADRPHFIRLRDDPTAGLVISQPQISRINQKWVIVLARRINQADGTFGGMVFAAIALEHLSHTFSEINVGTRGIVTLRDDKLGIVVRHPEPHKIGSVIGQKTAPAPLRKMHEDGKKSGTYRTLSTVDGIERTFSYRKIGDYPLLVIVGLASTDYLAEWRKLTLRLAALVALFALITLVAAWLIYHDRKRQAQTVKALAEQEARLRTVTDFTFDWEYWQGADMAILYMTPSCERVSGYSQAEFIADPGLLLSIIHPEDRHLMEQHLHDINYHEGSLVNFRIVRRDGAVRCIAHHCRAVTSQDGKPMGRRISNRDDTERKLMEEALRDSEERWKFALEGAGDGVWDWNLQSGQALYSKRWKEMLGYTEDEISNDSDEWVKRVHPDDISGVMTDIEEHLAGKTATAIVEFRMLSKDGSWKWILGRGMVASRDADGKPLRLVGTNTDISERKQAEAALLEKTNALLRSNADLEQFAYSISHDMRQPLRMVTGHLQLLERGLKDLLDQDNRENLNFALDGARRMDAMIVSLLEYSRVGRKTDTKQWMESRDSLDEALAFLAPASKENSADISVSGEWPRVFASRDELTRLFQNLIGNAVKYHPADQAPRVEVTSTTTSQLWRVNVRDHGIGIAPQQIDRLFQFFSRLQSRARFEGTGMGLALCRKIAEHHYGRIWVESEGEGLGSSFIFELPLNPTDATAGDNEPGEQAPLKRLESSAASIADSEQGTRLAVEGSPEQLIATFNRMATTAHSAQERLRLANADLTRFAEISAHHLMEPTRRITIYTQRLRTRLSTLPASCEDAEVSASLDYLEHDANRLRSLIRDVQLYLAAGEARGEIRLEDANAVLATLKQRLEKALTETGLEIEPLPPAVIDRPRLMDLFSVLLDNALQHGRPADPHLPPQIRIGGEREGKLSRYRVSDNGTGIPAQYRERVFEIFERLNTVNGNSGTGIGLSIARRIVESRHGRIWIENLPQGGAMVVFELPDGE